MTLRNFGIYSSRNLNIFQSFFILLKGMTSMKKVESIIDFGGGEIVDRINFEMAKVIENINNPNTDEKPRKLTIEVKLTPKNNRKTIEMQTSVKAKVSPINSVSTAMVIQQDDAKMVAFEADGLGDGQVDIFGEVHQIKYIELGNTETTKVEE